MLLYIKLSFLSVTPICQNGWDRWDHLWSVSELVFSPVLTLNCHSYSFIFFQWLDFTYFPGQFRNYLFFPSLISIIKIKADTIYYFVSLFITENSSYVALSVCLAVAQSPGNLASFCFSFFLSLIFCRSIAFLIHAVFWSL